jgi:hypothetical protein
VIEDFRRPPLPDPLCPNCRKPMVNRKCWGRKCCISLCACGKPTESAFISVCLQCEVRERRENGEMG